MASWTKPVRLYYNITAFRYENVQKGRYREFHQFGCEVFGSAGPAVDAELISLLHLFFRTLGLRQTSLRINSIGCPVCRAAYQEKLREYFRPHLGSICANCQERFERNPLRIIDCKEARCQQWTRQAPAQLDHLCPECQAHFAGLRASLEDLGLDYQIDRQIVRGLDYYTRTVFEFVSENVGTQGTICGGGRYDGLVETVGGPPTPGVGFALGVERLLMELAAQEIHLPDPPPMTLYVVAQSSARAASLALCHQLRQAGIRAETDLMDRSFGAQMKYAGKSGTRYLLVLGDDEIQSGQGRVRDLQTRAESEVALAELAGWLCARQAEIDQPGEGF
jgi:histidyl-tRNA synthetase